MTERPMTDWVCPQCGETNCDFEDWDTHCAFCGEVVYVLQNGDVDDMHYKVDNFSVLGSSPRGGHNDG